MSQSHEPHPHPDAVRRQVAAGLVRARRRAGLTQAQLADLLDLTTSAIRHRERARHPLRVDDLHRYARALRSTVRALLVDLAILADLTDRCPDCPHAQRNPGQPAGASAEGSALGERSTLHDPRGDASHYQPTADRAPAPAPHPDDPGTVS